MQFARLSLEQIEVVGAGPVVDPDERAAIRRPHGIDVLALVLMRQHLDRGGRDVHQRDAEVAVRQCLDVRVGAAVRRERDHAAIGRPRGQQVGERIVRETTAVAIQIGDEQVAHAAVQPREHEPPAVRRPARVGDAVQVEAQLLRDAPALQVVEIERVPAAALRRECDVAAVRGEGGARIHVAQ